MDISSIEYVKILGNQFRHVHRKLATYIKTYRNVVPFASAALSLCLLFLNQFETCVTVSAVISANSRFSRGLKISRDHLVRKYHIGIVW